jgi:hypothetical protein
MTAATLRKVTTTTVKSGLHRHGRRGHAPNHRRPTQGPPCRTRPITPNEQRCRARGLDAVLTKPFAGAAFQSLLHRSTSPTWRGQERRKQTSPADGRACCMG